MDEDQWMYDSIMSEEVDMDDQNEEECEWSLSHCWLLAVSAVFNVVSELFVLTPLLA